MRFPLTVTSEFETYLSLPFEMWFAEKQARVYTYLNIKLRALFQLSWGFIQLLHICRAIII